MNTHLKYDFIEVNFYEYTIRMTIINDTKMYVVSDILKQYNEINNTNKRIATSTGSTQGQGSVPDLLAAAVQQNVKPFDKQMDKWFDDQKKNGREINLTVRCWDSWENDLETEYDGEELTDCIQNWLKQNCVGGVFNLSDGTESFAQFEQVRIPLTDERGNAMDARAFATLLRKYLAKSPYNITAKVMQRGLGEAILVLGEK